MPYTEAEPLPVKVMTGGGSLSATANAALQSSAEGDANDPLSMDLNRRLRVTDEQALAVLQAMQTATGPVLVPSAGALVSGTTASMTGTTSTQVLPAPGAGLRNYVTALVVCNSHASVGTAIEIRDGDGGTVLMTIPAKEAFGGAVINLPVPLKQPTTATRLDAKNTVTGAAVIVTGVGYTGA